MKRNAMWMAAGLLSVATIWWTPACTSSDDGTGSDDSGTGEKDAGPSSTDGASSTDDSSTDPPDASKDDANTTAPDAGPIDPFVEACARIDACATATGPRIGMNGCYELLTATPFARQLDARARAQLENLECKLAATTCTAVRACDCPNADYVALCQQAGRPDGRHASMRPGQPDLPRDGQRDVQPDDRRDWLLRAHLGEGGRLQSARLCRLQDDHGERTGHGRLLPVSVAEIV